MLKYCLCFFISIILTFIHTSSADDRGQSLNAPIPVSARTLVNQGRELILQEKFDDAATAFKKATTIAPNYLKAHVEYIRLKIYYQLSYDEVRDEYNALIAKEPDNPVYPMALTMGALALAPARVAQARYGQVAALAPEWSWGHYAKAQLQAEKDQDAALAELNKALEIDQSITEAWNQLISIQEKAQRIDDAIATAEKMAAQPGTRVAGMLALWRLRLANEKGSVEAKTKLRAELDRMIAASKDIELLTAVRSAYKSILKEDDGVKNTEARLKKVDPGWFPSRDSAAVIIASNLSGVRRQEPIAGRQMALRYQSVDLNDEEKTPAERMTALEGLLKQNPNPLIRRFIYETLFKIAESAKDAQAILKYGQVLNEIDPTDFAVNARVALVLAENEATLAKAEKYAGLAYQSTAEFHPIHRPVMTDPDYFQDSVTEQRQRTIYKNVRTLALEAQGWILCKTGKCADGEPLLRQAVAFGRSERNLLHLSEALRVLGRIEDADKAATEARNEYAEAIKRKFTNDIAPDFQLETPDGRKVKLSDYKGKVVLLNFWATWCRSCAQEMPRLVELYDKYRERGFELLAISTDEKNDHPKIMPYVKQRNLNFPVLFDNGMEKAYNIDGLPTSVVVDKQGIIRYRLEGLDYKDEFRKAEIVLNELLK